MLSMRKLENHKELLPNHNTVMENSFYNLHDLLVKHILSYTFGILELLPLSLSNLARDVDFEAKSS